MQESLATEHGSELLGDTLEQLLDGGRVTNEGDGHLEATGRNVADSGLDVVGDPLNEIGTVLVLDVEHLLINLLGGHAATEHGSNGQVTTVAGVRGSHHVLGIEHLLGQLGNSQGTEVLGVVGGQGSETDHEEVKTGEGDYSNMNAHKPLVIRRPLRLRLSCYMRAMHAKPKKKKKKRPRLHVTQHPQKTVIALPRLTANFLKSALS